jgi:protein-tyrosine phosphatase
MYWDGILSRVRILFVCMGNICRSPTAEAVMRSILIEEGLEHAVEVDSAGTRGWHAGEPPDPRAQAAAGGRGIALDHAARQVTPADFGLFDLLLAMDADNLRDLRQIAPDEEALGRARLLREFDPAAGRHDSLGVPDPYYGGESHFEEVLDLVDAACRGLLAELREQGRL